MKTLDDAPNQPSPETEPVVHPEETEHLKNDPLPVDGAGAGEAMDPSVGVDAAADARPSDRPGAGATAEPTDDPGEGLPGLDRRRSIFLQFHRGAIIFFAVFGAYLISIYLDLWVNMGFTLLLDRVPLVLMKFVAVPFALEAGMGLAGLAVLYLLGRFIELPLWPALISFWIGLHLLDMVMKWLLDQFQYGYAEPRVLLLRLPGFLLFFLCSFHVFRAAQKRGTA